MTIYGLTQGKYTKENILHMCSTETYKKRFNA